MLGLGIWGNQVFMQLSSTLDGKRRMKKLMAYSLWLIVSLGLLAVVRDIARHNFPEQSPIIMGVAFAAVILVFFYIKDRVSHEKK